jgi:hypothetical protein
MLVFLASGWMFNRQLIGIAFLPSKMSSDTLSLLALINSRMWDLLDRFDVLFHNKGEVVPDASCGATGYEFCCRVDLVEFVADGDRLFRFNSFGICDATRALISAGASMGGGPLLACQRTVTTSLSTLTPFRRASSSSMCLEYYPMSYGC